jgi:hypothetical protein
MALSTIDEINIMANHVVNAIHLKNQNIEVAKSVVASENSAFDFNLIFPTPTTLADNVTQGILEALAHRLYVLDDPIDTVEEFLLPIEDRLPISEIINLKNKYYESLNDKYGDNGKLIDEGEFKHEYPILKSDFEGLGKLAFNNLKNHKAIDIISWKKRHWGLAGDAEGVEWKNKKLNFYTRWRSAVSCVLKWVEVNNLTGTYYVMDMGCMWWKVIEFKRGKIVSQRYSDKKDLRDVLKKGCGYSTAYIRANYNLD